MGGMMEMSNGYFYFFADLCILQVWVRNQYRIGFSSNSAIGRCLKKTIDIEKPFLEGIPIIGCEYRDVI